MKKFAFAVAAVAVITIATVVVVAAYQATSTREMEKLIEEGLKKINFGPPPQLQKEEL